MMKSFCVVPASSAVGVGDGKWVLKRHISQEKLGCYLLCYFESRFWIHHNLIDACVTQVEHKHGVCTSICFVFLALSLKHIKKSSSREWLIIKNGEAEISGISTSSSISMSFLHTKWYHSISLRSKTKALSQQINSIKSAQLEKVPFWFNLASVFTWMVPVILNHLKTAALCTMKIL